MKSVIQFCVTTLPSHLLYSCSKDNLGCKIADFYYHSSLRFKYWMHARPDILWQFYARKSTGVITNYTGVRSGSALRAVLLISSFYFRFLTLVPHWLSNSESNDQCQYLEKLGQEETDFPHIQHSKMPVGVKWTTSSSLCAVRRFAKYVTFQTKFHYCTFQIIFHQ